MIHVIGGQKVKTLQVAADHRTRSFAPRVVPPVLANHRSRYVDPVRRCPASYGRRVGAICATTTIKGRTRQHVSNLIGAWDSFTWLAPCHREFWGKVLQGRPLRASYWWCHWPRLLATQMWNWSRTGVHDKYMLATVKLLIFPSVNQKL